MGGQEYCEQTDTEREARRGPRQRQRTRQRSGRGWRLGGRGVPGREKRKMGETRPQGRWGQHLRRSEVHHRHGRQQMGVLSGQAISAVSVGPGFGRRSRGLSLRIHDNALGAHGGAYLDHMLAPGRRHSVGDRRRQRPQHCGEECQARCQSEEGTVQGRQGSGCGGNGRMLIRWTRNRLTFLNATREMRCHRLGCDDRSQRTCDKWSHFYCYRL